jgi:hypothetical protein
VLRQHIVNPVSEVVEKPLLHIAASVAAISLMSILLQRQTLIGWLAR